jgi:hypothetical protein
VQKQSVAILVSGHEYLRHRIDWARPSLSRERHLAQKSFLRPLQVVTIDVSRGSVRRAKFGLKTRADRPEVKIDQVKSPITDQNYQLVDLAPNRQTYVFNNGFKSVFSIVEIYKHILSTAANEGPLHELSFFSHAEYSGPVLTNTFEYERVGRVGSQYVLIPAAMQSGSHRDPDDLDPRPIDFTEANQTREELAQWKRLFTKAGSARLWGCQSRQRILILMRRVKAANPRVRKDTKDDTILRLNLTEFERECVSDLSKTLLTKTKQNNVYEMRFGDFKAVMQNTLRNTYGYRLAQAANTIVYAAAPGTYSDFKSGDVMYIHESTVDIVSVYEKALGLRSDPEPLGYVGYEPSTNTN